MTVLEGRLLVVGEGSGETLVLEEPLSLWGGLDPQTGEIIDRRHPQSGAIVSGRVLVMPMGRGSSSASSVLLEAVRLGTAPAAIVLSELDAILALGACVAKELYDRSLPVLVLSPESHAQLQDRTPAVVELNGTLRLA